MPPHKINAIGEKITWNFNVIAYQHLREMLNFPKRVSQISPEMKILPIVSQMSPEMKKSSPLLKDLKDTGTLFNGKVEMSSTS